MLQGALRYSIVFCAGLAVASIMPGVAIPVKETVREIQVSKETLLAQGSNEDSLNVLAGCLKSSGLADCLERAGYINASALSSPSGEPAPSYSDGTVNNPEVRCTNLRFERRIEDEIGCVYNGDSVQVQFEERRPNTRWWKDEWYVFVISYEDGSKGWVLDKAINYDRSPKL